MPDKGKKPQPMNPNKPVAQKAAGAGSKTQPVKKPQGNKASKSK